MSTPLPKWVVPGAPVRCAYDFEISFDEPDDETVVVTKGMAGRILSVGEESIRVYLGPLEDEEEVAPVWNGIEDPQEPYLFVDHALEDFDGLWLNNAS